MKFELTNKLIKFAKELDFTQVVSCELSEGFYGGKIKYEDEQYFVTFSRQSNEAYKFEGIAPYLNSEDIRNLEELAKEKIKMLSYLVDSFSVVVPYASARVPRVS